MKTMVETIKENGNIDINELSKAQLIALIAHWNCPDIYAENDSFSAMLKRCYKSKPWHEYSPIIYICNENKVITIGHAFYHLNEKEEECVLNALKK